MEIALAYKKGVDWFPTLNDSYKSLIGALELNVDIQQSQTGCQCDEYEYGELVSTTFISGVTDCESLNQGNGYIWSYECSPVYSVSYSYTYKDSDGFILKESAQAIPNNVHVSDMPGSNHLQMRNDGNTKDKLDALFTGAIHPYFLTK